MSVCVFCESPAARLAIAPLGATACVDCAARVGRLFVDQRELALAIFPGLIEEAEEIGPEPRVRLADGRSVELREHTAELKKTLTPSQRTELAESYVALEMWREATLEAAQALREGVADELAERAFAVLFHPRIAVPIAAVAIRGLLFRQ